MPSFMPVPSAWFVPVIGALSPMISGASSACTQTVAASRSLADEPVAAVAVDGARLRREIRGAADENNREKEISYAHSRKVQMSVARQLRSTLAQFAKAVTKQIRSDAHT